MYMKRTKVVCVGEALIDRIKNKSNKKFKDFFGGAPANVACALRKLKIDTAFIGCLGTDKFGRDLLSRIILGSRLSLSAGFFSVLIYLLIRLEYIKV